MFINGGSRGVDLGNADALLSAFHLGYNMILNCIRVETADVEVMIAKSFHKFQVKLSLTMMRVLDG